MATITELEVRLETLKAQRDSAVARVSYDGRTVEYRGTAEIARAAAAIYGLDRFEERHWRRMEEAMSQTGKRDDGEPASPPTPLVRPPARRVIHSGYMAR